MKFRIRSSNYCLNSEVDKFLDEYPMLNEHGLEVEEFEQRYETRIRIHDENGVAIVQPVSRVVDIKRASVTIHTLEQLMDLIKAVNHSIIVSEDAIEIYDGYRE